jgi:hypothetical protein
LQSLDYCSEPFIHDAGSSLGSAGIMCSGILDGWYNERKDLMMCIILIRRENETGSSVVVEECVV